MISTLHLLWIIPIAGSVGFFIAALLAGNENRERDFCVAPSLNPMGCLTYAIACSMCKNRGGHDCEECRCEVKSHFELDPEVKIIASKGKLESYGVKERDGKK